MSKGKASFKLTPEIVQDATVALLLGDFNNWNPEEGIPMNKQDDGSFYLEIDLHPGQYQYRYYLNDGRWVNDHNQAKASSGYADTQNCVVIVEEMVFIPLADEHNSPEAIEPATKKSTHKKTAKKAEAPKTEKAAVAKKHDDKATNSGMFAKQYHDLTQVEGITEDIQDLLYKADIRTFGVLAKASNKKLKEVFKNAGKRYADVNFSNWAVQARKINSK